MVVEQAARDHRLGAADNLLRGLKDKEEATVQVVDGTSASVQVDADKLATPPFTLDPPTITATYLIVVTDPDGNLIETQKDNNTKWLELKRLVIGPDFRTADGHVSLNGSTWIVSATNPA